MLMERLADIAADELGIDPAEIRRRNLITVRCFSLCDCRPASNSIPAIIRGCWKRRAANRSTTTFVRTRDARRKAGEVCGIGICVYTEPCGQGWESAEVRLDPERPDRCGDRFERAGTGPRNVLCADRRRCASHASGGDCGLRMAIRQQPQPASVRWPAAAPPSAAGAVEGDRRVPRKGARVCAARLMQADIEQVELTVEGI